MNRPREGFVSERFRWGGRSRPERQAILSVALLIGIVASLLVLTNLGFETISAARAYVGGEGLWSKAQKDAVYHLVRYAYGHDPKDHTAFLTALSVPLGDRQARLELERHDPDYSLVYQGFRDGRNHPADIDRMTRFFRRFRHVGFVESAIGSWTQGDSLIVLLAASGDRLHQEISSGHPVPANVQAELAIIDRLSHDLMLSENAFSRTMGEGARWTARVLMMAILGAAVVLVALAVMVTWRVVRRLRQSEESLEVSEAQLRQAQKMEAVGQFTGGIAHDFNNLLTVILSTVDLLETQLPAEMPQARSDLADIRRAADRGAGMIRKLLAFSRERQLQFRPHRLHELVQDAGTMLRRVLPEHIELRIDCGLETPAVRTDPAAIEQILLNLGTNARDAMPGGGTLRILTGVADLEPARAAKLGPRVRPGMYATLRVSDTGVGMVPSVLERFFEPFFTTKPPGQGSGLGAAMVYGLVEQHGGAAEVQSAPGEGTTVILYFPLADGQPITVEAPGGDLPRGSETILLVEDEDSVRTSTRRLLERQGYGVLEAANGDQGLSLYQAHQSEIALVLSDVVMPRLTGPALHQALRRMGGAVPFLFMSGYTAREIGAEVDLPPGAAFIAKPWTVEELLVAVRRALDSAGARR